MSLRRVLLTGFEPFASFSVNPTQRLAKEIKACLGIQLKSQVLAVDFAQMQDEYPKILSDYQPTFILNLGLNAGANVVMLEHFAQNLGVPPNESSYFPILEGEPMAYKTNLNVDFLAHKLCEKGIPSMVSNHAGNYLCNYVYYHSLHYVGIRGGSALFMHLPFHTEYICELASDLNRSYASLPYSYLKNAVQIIMRGAAQ